MAEQADRGPADAVRSPTDNEPSDRSLLRLVRHGNQEAARLLYQRYAHRLRALARSRRMPDLVARVDEDDIVQSVFGSFFRGLLQGSYDVPAGQELWHLFFAITRNKILAKGVYHRAGKRDVRRTTGDDHFDRVADRLATDSQAESLLKLSVDEALERLPERHQEVIRLRLENYEVEEIARTMNCSKRSVERILQEGRARLRKTIAFEGDGESGSDPESRDHDQERGG